MHGSAFLDEDASMARTTAAAHREIGTFDQASLEFIRPAPAGNPIPLLMVRWRRSRCNRAMG